MERVEQRPTLEQQLRLKGRLSSVIQSRDRLLEEIGIKTIRPDVSEELDEKIIRVRYKVRQSKGRAQAHLLNLEEELPEVYYNELISKQARLGRMRTYANNDSFSLGILERREAELRDLISLSATDSHLETHVRTRIGSDPRAYFERGFIDYAEYQIAQKFQNFWEEQRQQKKAAHIEPPTPPAEGPKEPEIPDEEKPKEEEEIILDGQSIPIIGKLTKIAVRMLINTMGADKISAPEVARALYGKVDKQTVRNAESLIHDVYHRHLEPRGYRLSLSRAIGTMIPGFGLNYFLEQIQPTPPVETPPAETVPPAPPAEPEGEAQPKKVILLDYEKRSAVLEDRVVLLSGLEFALFSYVADPARLEDDRKSKSIKSALKQAGSKNDSVIGVTAGGIRKKLGADIFNLVRKGSKGNTTFIWLINEKFDVKQIIPIITKEGADAGTITKPPEPAEEERLEDARTKKYKEGHQIFDITLPDGQTIKVRGKIKGGAGEALTKTSKGNQLQSDQAAIVLHGSDTPENRHLASQTIRKLAKEFKAANWQVIQPVGSNERATGKLASYYIEKIQVEEPVVKPEEEKLPEIHLDKENKTLTVNGRTINLTDREYTLIKPLYEAEGQPVPLTVITEMLKAKKYLTRASTTKSDLEKRLGQTIIVRVGSKKEGYQYVLPRSIPQPETQPAVPPPPPMEQPPKTEPGQEEKLKRYREGKQIFDMVIDGRQIKVQGRLTMLSLQTLASTSSDDKMPITDFVRAVHGKDDQETITKYRDLMRMNNQRSFPKLGFRVVIEGKRDQATIYLERLAKEGELPDETTSGTAAPSEISEVNIESLQKELADLYQFRTEIQEQVAQGIWPQSDLDELIAEITQKEAQIRLRQPSEPETLVDLEGLDQKEANRGVFTQPKPGGEEIETIPYHPEQLRTQEETSILQYIVGELTQYSRLWFQRWQDALLTDDRVKLLLYGKRQVTRYERWELNEKFKSAYHKMARESLIPLMRTQWGEVEKESWQKAENLLRRLGEGEERILFREVNKLIDRAAKEHYDMHPDEHEGDPIII